MRKDNERLADLFHAFLWFRRTPPNPWHSGSSHRLRYSRRCRQRLNCLSGQGLVGETSCSYTGIRIMRIRTNRQTKNIHVQQGATGACEHSRVNILVRKPYHASFSILSFFLLCCCDTAPHHNRRSPINVQAMFYSLKHHEQNKSPNKQF